VAICAAADAVTGGAVPPREKGMRQTMRTSQYARAVPALVAQMNEDTGTDDGQQPVDGLPGDQQGASEKKAIYVYQTDDGGVFLSPIKVAADDQPPAPVVDSQEPETDQRPTACRQLPYFLHFLLMLLLFVCLDNLDSVFAQFAPTVSVTITPVVKTITTSAAFSIGTGSGDVRGRVLPAVTLSQSQTVEATGQGHQDARAASGTLIFYNGSFAPKTIPAGAVYTGRGGVQVATDQAVMIPAANPPYVGQATVDATATHAGASGNIEAGDISVTTSTLQVSNSQFSGGQDARDFTYVTRGDIQRGSRALTPVLLQGEQGALSGQLQPGETLATPTCTPNVLANHHPDEEAASVEVTVSETCRAIAYSQQSLQVAASQFVHTKPERLGPQYQPVGEIQVTVRSVSVSVQDGSTTVGATIHGTWVYQINERQVQTLVAGKPRLAAMRLLQTLPGIQSISIAGIADNSPLPTDLSYIHILILVQE
jgi:Baseplate J-like protein